MVESSTFSERKFSELAAPIMMILDISNGRPAGRLVDMMMNKGDGQLIRLRCLMEVMIKLIDVNRKGSESERQELAANWLINMNIGIISYK